MTIRIKRKGRDYRQKSAFQQDIHNCRIYGCDSPNVSEGGILYFPLQQFSVHSRNTGRGKPGPQKIPNDALVYLAAQNHFHNFQGFFIRNPQAIFKAAFHAKLVQ